MGIRGFVYFGSWVSEFRNDETGFTFSIGRTSGALDDTSISPVDCDSCEDVGFLLVTCFSFLCSDAQMFSDGELWV